MNKEMWNKKRLKRLDFVVFYTILHYFINKYYKWYYCYIKTVFTKHPYFSRSSYGWPGIVVRELGQIISKDVIKS